MFYVDFSPRGRHPPDATIAVAPPPPHSDTHPTSEWFNALMIALHRREARWLERHNLPVGISFLTIRRKRD